MDLKTLEGTSALAIEAVYRLFYNFIPEKYRVTKNDDTELDIEPFYDPKLEFDNRLHYELVKNSIPNREAPWFIITWNTDRGILKSELTNRRFETCTIALPSGNKARLKFINANMTITLAIAYNSTLAAFELQENILLKLRESMYVMSKPHSVVGEITVSLNKIEHEQKKLDRDKGTLGYLFVRVTIDYPVFGYGTDQPSSVIKEINLLIKNFNEEKYSLDRITPKTLTDKELEEVLQGRKLEDFE